MSLLPEGMLNCLGVQFDCGHFKKANEWLALRYGEGGIVNWNLDGSTMVKQKNVPVKGTPGAGVPTEGEQTELSKGGQKLDKLDAEFGDAFDPDEEEAMVQAAIEIEKREANTK